MTEEYKKEVEAFMELAHELMTEPKNDLALQWNNHISRAMQRIKLLKIPMPQSKPSVS